MIKIPKLRRKEQQSDKGKSKKTELVKYHSFRLEKRIKGEKITGSFRLMRQSLAIIGRNWKLFLGIMFWYALFSVLLVQGFKATSDINQAKDTLDQTFSGNWSQLASSAGLFAYMLGTSGTGSATEGTYQVLLAILFSLALIWGLRQIYAKGKVRIRDTFYMGMTPLVPFSFVLVVIGLELIPFAVGATLYGMAAGNDIIASTVEQILWVAILVVLALFALYMLASTVFALYISALPGMKPMAALKAARQLVRNRRWAVIRRILFLPAALIVLTGLIVIPIIMFATSAAGVTLFVITLLLLPIIHSYMYALYRALI